MSTNLKQDLKSIKIIHTAFMLGVFFFLIISVYINTVVGNFAFDPNSFESKLLFIASNVLGIISITAGAVVFKQRMKDIEAFDLLGKIQKYREASIIRSATIESTTFFFIVCFLLSGSYIFIAEAIAGFAILGFFYPTNDRISKEINHDIKDLY